MLHCVECNQYSLIWKWHLLFVVLISWPGSFRQVTPDTDLPQTKLRGVAAYWKNFRILILPIFHTDTATVCHLTYNYTDFHPKSVICQNLCPKCLIFGTIFLFTPNICAQNQSFTVDVFLGKLSNLLPDISSFHKFSTINSNLAKFEMQWNKASKFGRLYWF